MLFEHLVLHACCTPCTIKSYERLVSGQAVTRDGEPVDAARITLLYYNPNIAPIEEYERRRDAWVAYCAQQGIEAVELEYEPQLWEEATAPDQQVPKRCRQCYALRLGRAARWAAEHGADALTTTLTISPYQLPDIIAEEGRAAVKRCLTLFPQDSRAISPPRPVAPSQTAFISRRKSKELWYLDIDFSPDYRASQNAARAAGIYVQNYCGCLPSKREAEEQRTQRRAARKAAHEQAEGPKESRGA
ncbi:MAG: epoxyqueuosine reductase QueH [Coriobacteriia bacterium]|nr:epoxyqueuosine reductase QueH [Coriobacteriia bacterium]